MIIHTPQVAGNLPIKTLVARQLPKNHVILALSPCPPTFLMLHTENISLVPRPSPPVSACNIEKVGGPGDEANVIQFIIIIFTGTHT